MGKVQGYINAAVSSITYGMIPLFTFPLMAEGMKSSSILFYRFLAAALIIGGILIYRKEKLLLKSRELPAIALLGLLYTGSSLFLFWSFNYLAGGVAATIMFLYPVFVAIVMGVFYKERISPMTAFAIGIAILGVFLLYKGDGEVSLSLTGVIFALLSGFSYGGYMMVVNKNRTISEMSGLRVTFYACAITAILCAVNAMFTGGIQGIPSVKSWVNIALLALLPTVFSCLALASAVRSIGSTITSVIGSLEPLSAVFCGMLFLDEPFTSSLAIGIFMIVASVIIIIIEKARAAFISSLKSVVAKNRHKNI